MTVGADWILAIESAVLHGIWQVAAIGAAVGIVFASRPTLRPAIRADIASAALLASAATFVFTCCWSLAHTDRAAIAPGLADLPSMSAAIADEASNRGTTGPDGGATGYAAALSGIWLAGLLVLTSWTLVQALRTRRLRTRTFAAPSDWQARFEVLARQAGVGSGVRLLASRIVDVPMVVGWLRPVILIPASAFTAIPRAQLEVVLLHELAHIRRHDPLFDLLQRVAVNLLFFHPVAWHLRRIVVVQRELACDDDAAADGEASRSLAQALLRIQSLRHAGAHARLLTPLSSQGDPLMSRITRLLTDSARIQRRGGPTRGRLAAGTAVLALGFSMTLAWARPADPPRSKIVASAQMEMLETLSDALKRSVADGEISKEAAMAMYLQFADAIELAIPKGESVSDDDRLEALQERYEAVEDMLEAGKISPEKAEAMFGRLEIAMKAALNDNDKKKTPTIEQIQERHEAVEDMLEAGKISPEKAEAMFGRLEIAMKAALNDNDKKKTPTIEQIQERHEAVEDMLEAGKISPEKAEAMFGRLEIAMKAALNDNDKKKTPTIEQIQERHEAVEGMLEDSLDRTLAEIEAKVRSGAIGRDEAARWVRAIQLANTIVEIEDSVKDGDLPRSEADAIYRELGIK